MIFGHTHQVDEGNGYANSGSFGYSQHGRPYVRVDDSGSARVERL